MSNFKNLGVASDLSSSDGVIYFMNNASESNISSNDTSASSSSSSSSNTGAAYSPLEAQGKAFSEGVNLVISQLQHGLMWDECCVALLLSNGELRLLNPQVSKVCSL
jgi:hypothetical protein